MCWSATADLVAGSVITAAGGYCVVRTVRARRLRELPVAGLPVLLGVHQLVEAAVWSGGGGTGPATTAWAVIAFPVAALWVPLAVLIAGPARPRLWWPVGAGLLVAGFLAYRMALRPVSAEIRGHTVGYGLEVPYAGLVLGAYLLATVGALLLSPARLLRLLGALVAAGAVICAALWHTEFVSTWCAFAAAATLLLTFGLHPLGGSAPGPPVLERRTG
ncbi:hypothetical protein LG634_11465 [Streptomyces bambusae]|uniref:DUF6629 family protein n=1 Tax=Streptomyces bambusae TaxID=1550616 RepID=UPI001CFCEDAF|nr:DUF6629 family protein [Streptomyces bambusae]MCB5165447.1 hypothetical protein [Streptomyces bambusae]